MTRDEKIEHVKRFIQRLQEIVATADVDDDCKQALPRFNKCEQNLISFLGDAGFQQDASIIASHANYIPATYGTPLIYTMREDVEFYCRKLNAMLEDLLHPIYTPKPKPIVIKPSGQPSPAPHQSPITVTGSHNKVFIHSTDSSTAISIETVFHDVEDALKRGLTNSETRTAALALLAELRSSLDARDTPSAWQKYRSFIAVVADHLALLQPFLPQLTALLPT